MAKQKLGIIFLSLSLCSGQLNAAGHRRHNAAPASSSRAMFLVGGAALVGGIGILLSKYWPTSNAYTQEDLDRHYKKSASNGLMTVTATAVLRFPHMLSDLMDQNEKGDKTARPSVLILGAGSQDIEEFGIELPFVHEIAAVFPSSDLDIVDLDPNVAGAINKSHYRVEFALDLAKRVVEDPENFSRFSKGEKSKQAQRSRELLKGLFETIPLSLSEHENLKINVTTDYFELFTPSKSYDFIIATKSIIYPLVADILSTYQKRNLVQKYLSALKENGRLYVDFQTFILIETLGVDLDGFKYEVLEHTSNYGKPSNCEQKKYAKYDYIACLRARSYGRVSTTEDIVVFTRK